MNSDIAQPAGMKVLHKMVPLLSCAAIVLAPPAASALEAPEVSATASADGNYGVPGKVDTVKAAGGSVSASAVVPSYNVVSNTFAAASPGNLSGRVKSVDNDGYFYASGSTDSRWRDNITINALGKTGQRGIATLNFKVTGVSTFESNDGNCRTEVSASATVNEGGRIWEIRRGKTILPNGSYYGDDYLGGVQSLDFQFTYGEPFSMTVVLGARSGTSGSGGGVGFADMNADLIWLGFTNIRASDAVTKVPSATVRSESKTNYIRPIGVDFSTVTIRSNLSQLSENPAQTATITVSLNKPAPTVVRVDLAYSGTATLNGDYSTRKPSYVFIEKGATQTSFTIRSINDVLIEGPEKVSIRVLPGVGYGIGQAHTADVTILSDE